MAYTVTYRTIDSLTADQEAAVREAVDTFNQGRTWVLAVFKNERDGHLSCRMKPQDMPDADVAAGKAPWPGAYDGKCLLDGLCQISRECQVDWEIHTTYSVRPIGTIRGGVCHADEAAQAEESLNMARKYGLK